MGTTSSTTNDGNTGRCPFCGEVLSLAMSATLIDVPCPACGLLIWYVSVGDTVFVFDKNKVPPDDWVTIEDQIPSRNDDSVRWIEKLLHLASIASS